MGVLFKYSIEDNSHFRTLLQSLKSQKMGITRELARSVFSKNRSFGTHDQNHNNQKKRFRAVRSYLCGDELINSVMAEEDSASIKSSEFTISHPISNSFGTTIVHIEPETENSEATVTQPVNATFENECEIQSNENPGKEKGTSAATLFHREDAAMVIQSAFRGFLERRWNKEMESWESNEGVFTEMASRDSVGTSVEVQTGNSIEVFSTEAETMAVHNRMKLKARAHALKLKEDWDDSTVSSNIIKLRMQNRLEATTRRERALAYAFSQQLRICSKKKQNGSNDPETNMGWSWLERWMATKAQEKTECFENNEIHEIEAVSINRRSSPIRKRFLVLPGEEMESCGSNEVSSQIVSDSFSTTKERYITKTTKRKLKAKRSVSKRKTVPSSYCPGETSKKACPKAEEMDKENKPKQLAGSERRECNISAVMMWPVTTRDDCTHGPYS